MSARIPPVEAPYSPEAASVLRRMMPGDEEPLALFRLYARMVPMAEALHGWGWYHAISFTARATRLAPEPGTPRFREIPLPDGSSAEEGGRR
ncbi:hypothetical protein WKI65_40165 [Streptomyces sp. MS1.AVA.3]|uniref:hypothetical protein n=1 Tax=Streptomyces decoyicus TaxID=249567 RepID=UPI0030BC6E3D